jgi:hypothetical protein
MKKLLVKPILALFFVASAAVLSAGSLDYLSNQNASYYLNMAGVSATDGAEIVPFNPAGTALLDKGFYLDVASQTLFKFYAESEDAMLKEDYKLNNPTPFLPSLAAVYNFGKLGAGNLSVYLNGGICAGGGIVDWSDGTVGTDGYRLKIASSSASAPQPGSSTSLEASSVYYGLGVGVGYSFLDDMLSASAGVRYVMAERTTSLDASWNFLHGGLGAWTLKATYEDTQEARGFTPIFGFDARPIKGLTLGLRYEMETELEFEYETDSISATVSNAALNAVAVGLKNELDKDGEKFNQNLPQIISFGAEYDFTSAFTMNFQTTVYMMNLADLEGMEDDYNLGYEVALAGRYALNEKFLFGGSVMYTESGAKDEIFENDGYLMSVSANPPLDSLMFGLGAKYMVFKNFNVLLSGSYVNYLTKDVETDAGLEITYKKQVFNLGLGVSYMF